MFAHKILRNTLFVIYMFLVFYCKSNQVYENYFVFLFSWWTLFVSNAGFQSKRLYIISSNNAQNISTGM